MSEKRAIPMPVPMPETQLDEEFWGHCAQERLCFQRCKSCSTWRHLPRNMCAACGSSDWEWSQSSGRGRIYSWTVAHQAMHPALADEVPYAVVVVELEEGVRMVSRTRDIDPSQLELDLPVRVRFERVSDQFVLPFFGPARA